MDQFHQQLARIAFNASDDLGLVLAGGYAISAHHLTSRPSRDLDFATVSTLPLDVITNRLADVYRAAGYGVQVIETALTMARFEVHDGDQRCEVDLLKAGIQPPVRLDIGPVLALDDAVGLKAPGWPRKTLRASRLHGIRIGTRTSTIEPHPRNTPPPVPGLRQPLSQHDDSPGGASELPVRDRKVGAGVRYRAVICPPGSGSVSTTATEHPVLVAVGPGSAAPDPVSELVKGDEYDGCVCPGVAFTGVSGSGKTSLAFGTLYAEAQRRYFESVAPYARRRLQQVGAPHVREITGRVVATGPPAAFAAAEGSVTAPWPAARLG